MLKTKAYFKDIIREIWKTRSRFLSIFAIVALGSGFFAGIKSTSPDMKTTAQVYYQANNLMDLHIKSTMGLDENDIAALSKLENIRSIAAGYSADAFVQLDNNNNIVVRAYSIDISSLQNDENYINKPILLSGRFPENKNECVVDKGSLAKYFGTDNDEITLIADDGDISDTLNTSKFRIVGIVQSPSYITDDRGSSQIGNGTIRNLIYLPKEVFAYEVYTDAYLTFNDTKDVLFYDPLYESIINGKIDQAEAIAKVRQQARYDEIYNEANAKIVDGQNELNKGIAEYKSNENKFNTEIANAETQLAKAKSDLNSNEAQLTDAQNQIDGLNQLLSGVNSLISNFQYTSIPLGTDLPEQTKSIIEGSKAFNAFLSGGISFNTKLEDYIRADAGTPEKMALYTELTAYTSMIQTAVQGNQASLDSAKAALDAGKTALTLNEQTLAAQKQDGQRQLADAWTAIEDGQRELDDARAKLAELKMPKWYVFDRTDNPGYSGFVDDAERVDKIAQVFPLFFILVAALVCLTTMTRMVEEQRTEIGTLKALGYSKWQNIAKYIIYAVTASVLGSLAGLSIGFKLFPTVIFNAYKTLYSMTDIIAPFHWGFALICIGVSALCTGLAAFAACYKELISSPAELMRPKAPKAGKSVLLEKSRFIWNRLNFLQKVTARNLFRYKKKIFMTVIGIAGCTAMLLTGFGMRYSVTSIVDKQYGEISKYDLIAIFDENMGADEFNTLVNELNNNNYIAENMLMKQKTIDISSGNVEKDVYLLVADDAAAIEKFINIKNRITQEKITLPKEGAVITEKISKMLSLKVGDTFTLFLNDDRSVELKVTGIMENYTLNYVYLSKDAYMKAFAEAPVYNSFLANMKEPTKDNENKLYTQLMDNKNMLSVSYTSASGKNFSDIVSSLNYVVLLIIISAGTLAFVVLYNLANINVTERLREIATIKVLGFYDKEVSSYIHRENTISSLIGMIIGLFLGIPFEKFVMGTAEVDAVMFLPGMNLPCYLYAIGLTLAFTYIVNFALHFRLKKVDMVESLKSME